MQKLWGKFSPEWDFQLKTSESLSSKQTQTCCFSQHDKSNRNEHRLVNSRTTSLDTSAASINKLKPFLRLKHWKVLRFDKSENMPQSSRLSEKVVNPIWFLNTFSASLSIDTKATWKRQPHQAGVLEVAMVGKVRLTWLGKWCEK